MTQHYEVTEMMIKKDHRNLIYCLMFLFLAVAVVAAGENEALAKTVLFITYATVLITASRQQPEMILTMKRAEDGKRFDPLDDD